MPAKAREEHAHIQPGTTDTTNCLSTGGAHGEEGAVCAEGVVEVEGIEGVVEVLVPTPIAGCHWEAAAVAIDR